MKKFIFLSLLTLILSSCNDKPTANCSSDTVSGATVEREGEADPTTCPDDSTTIPDDTAVTPEPDDDTTDDDSSGVVPNAAELFGADVSFTNFTNSDEEKVQRALDLIRQVVRTPEFREKVLNHKYNGSKTFANNNGKTNEQIYESFLDGAETLRPEKNHIMDLQLELYTNNSNNVVGYTYPNVLKIWMNRKYFNQYEPCQVSRNLFHEWTHKLGYGHDSAVTAKRPYSVPYAVGNIIQDLACDL